MGLGGKPRWVALTLALAGVLLGVASLRIGSSGSTDLASSLQASLAVVGLSEPLEGSEQLIVRLRLYRTCVAAGVGASLALAGALLQGLFRNGLASPAVVGVTAGSVLGASVAIAFVGGLAPAAVLGTLGGASPLFVTAAAFAGALLAALFVILIATSEGSVSVPTLLMAGIAVNTVVAGLLAAMQSFAMEDYEVSRAILAWTFGTLDDRSAWHVALVWSGLGLASLSIPFVAVELDLFAGGERDAQALGVDVRRVKALALGGAALSTAAAVSVAGQVAFVGLVVPHLVRMLTGSSHRRLLPLSMLFGAVFLLGCDVAQRTFLGAAALRPGVLMSLLGGPFFLLLLYRDRRALTTW